MLDTYGDEATFGKAIGGDIMDNKKTFLLVAALDKASSAQRQELVDWINAENPDRTKKINAVKKIYDKIGVRRDAEERINELSASALEILRSMEISAEGKRFLTDFATSLIKRTR